MTTVCNCPDEWLGGLLLGLCLGVNFAIFLFFVARRGTVPVSVYAAAIEANIKLGNKMETPR